MRTAPRTRRRRLTRHGRQVRYGGAIFQLQMKNASPRKRAMKSKRTPRSSGSSAYRYSAQAAGFRLKQVFRQPQDPAGDSEASNIQIVRAPASPQPRTGLPNLSQA